MILTKILMKDGDSQSIKTPSDPEITCETGFIRFYFDTNNSTILVNSNYIVSVTVDTIEETKDDAIKPATSTH